MPVNSRFTACEWDNFICVRLVNVLAGNDETDNQQSKRFNWISYLL